MTTFKFVGLRDGSGAIIRKLVIFIWHYIRGFMLVLKILVVNI